MNKILVTLAALLAILVVPSTAEGDRPEPTRPVSEVTLCASSDPVESAAEYRPCIWPGNGPRLCMFDACISIQPTKAFIVPETGESYRTTRRMARFLLGIGYEQGAGRTFDCAVSAPHPCPYR